MALEVQGVIVSIEPAVSIQTNSGKVITKRELILDITRHDAVTGERSPYDNTPVFEFIGDDCQQLDLYVKGQVVKIQFDLRGIAYTDKQTGQRRIFNSIRPYRIEGRPMQQQPQTAPQQAAPQCAQQPTQYNPPQGPLPF